MVKDAADDARSNLRTHDDEPYKTDDVRQEIERGVRLKTKVYLTNRKSARSSRQVATVTVDVAMPASS